MPVGYPPAMGSVTQRTDAGAMYIENADGIASMYSATINGASIATPVYVSYFFILRGSATQVVRVIKVELSGTETTAGIRTFAAYLLTGLAGGTPSVITPTAFDSASAPPTATVTGYFSGTTPSGTTSYPLNFWSMFLPAAGTASAPSLLMENYGVYLPAAPVVLRGTNQYFAVTLVGGAIAGAAMNVTITWTEENQ